MSDNSQLQAMRVQAMELLALSVLDLFPNTSLVQGKASNADLYYDFVFDIPLTEQGLTLIEERWRKALKEFTGFETLEMMRENAASLFEHYGQLYKAEDVLAQEENIVTLIRSGDFYDLKPIGLEDFEGRVYPKIVSSILYAGITRLEGLVFEDQKELKAAVKLRKQAVSHQEIGKREDLFSCNEGNWCFFPKGEELKRLVIEAVERECKSMGFYPVSFSGERPSLQVFKRSGINGIAVWEKNEGIADDLSGLIQPCLSDTLKIFVLESDKILLESCISSLQFIQKIIKIFDLKHEWVFRSYRPKEVTKKKWQTQADLLKSAAEQCGIGYSSDSAPEFLFADGKESYPRLEISVYDVFGRRWSISTVSFENCENKDFLVISPLVSLERMIALLLEQKAGQMPEWLRQSKQRFCL